MFEVVKLGFGAYGCAKTALVGRVTLVAWPRAPSIATVRHPAFEHHQHLSPLNRIFEVQILKSSHQLHLASLSAILNKMVGYWHHSAHVHIDMV